MSEKTNKKVAIDTQEIVNKLCEKLKKSGWYDLLRGFLMSSEFTKIIEQLEEQVNNGKRFTPTIKDIFAAFEECPYDKCNVVLIGPEPSKFLGYSDGLAFSCKVGPKPYYQKLFQDGITRSFYNNEKKEADMPFGQQYLAKQGVLMLNMALTAEVDKADKHYKIWKPFMSYFLDMLSGAKFYPGGGPVIYILIGKEASEISDLVLDYRYLHIFEEFPEQHEDGYLYWNCRNVFHDVNLQLNRLKKTPIIW